MSSAKIFLPKQYHKIVLLALLLILAASCVPLSAETASAGVTDNGDIYVWDGEGADNLASTAANWYKNSGGTITDDVAPVSGSNVRFNATSSKVCSWDLAGVSVETYSFTIATGYSGTVTQGAVNISIGSGGFIQQAGTATFLATNTVTCSGNWTKTGGTLTSSVLRLITVGNCTISGLESDYLKGLYNYGTLTIATSTNLAHSFAHDFLNEGTINIPSTKSLNVFKYADTASTFVNNGIIQGAGSISFNLRQDYAPSLGNCSCTVTFMTNSATTRSNTVTAAAPFSTGALSVSSAHASNTMTLDLAGHSLNANGITIGTRGELKGGEGVIRNSGNFDSSAGTWTPDTSALIMEGSGKTIKTAAGQTFYRLNTTTGSNITQASNIAVTDWMDPAGTWNKATYTLTAPLPSFSTSAGNATEDTAYTYGWNVNRTQTSTTTVVTNASWLTTNLGSWTATGAPTNAEVGSYYYNVTLTNVIGTVYQNSTIVVNNTASGWQSDPITEWTYGNTYLYDAQTDDEWNGITYSFTHTGGMDWWIEPDSGILRCHITDGGSTDISLLADDGHGSVIYQNFTVTFDMLQWDHQIDISTVESQNYRVTFDFIVNDSYTGNVARVQWNFGDGFGSKDASAVHQYEKAGSYLITCWVKMADGSASSTTKEITVGDPAVVSEIDNRIAAQLQQAVLLVALVAIGGVLASFGYVRYAGGRGKFDRMVLYMIAVAVLAISALIIGGALI